MEEILASIRRIIADDDATKSAQRSADAAQPPASRPAMPPPPPTPSVPPPALPAAPEPSVAAASAEPPPVRQPPALAAIEGSAEEHDEPADVLDLTDSMAVPESSAPAPVAAAPPPVRFRKIDGQSDLGFAELAEKTLAPSVPEAPGRGFGDDERGQLLSQETSAAVDSAFNTLAQTVLVHNARTLEDLVREMLRPMLKSWLDDNLPGMVERLVRAEIERVSRGR